LFVGAVIRGSLWHINFIHKHVPETWYASLDDHPFVKTISATALHPTENEALEYPTEFPENQNKFCKWASLLKKCSAVV